MSIKEHVINFEDPKEAVITIINIWRDQLIGYRSATSHSEDLEWEIRFYDFMLKDPVARLEAYKNARSPGRRIYRTKQEAVKILGWEIP